MEEKLDLDDADSSGYAIFGSLLGSWETRCVRKGCGEDRVDLAGLDNHPRRHTFDLLTHTIYYSSYKSASTPYKIVSEWVLASLATSVCGVFACAYYLSVGV